jgi:predicted SAM-dependent methyltransferase
MELNTKPDTNPEQIQNKTLIDIFGAAPCKGLLLNIGSGKDYRDGYINIDKYDITADADWDIEHLPLRDRTVAQIVCVDCLEHVPHQKVLPILCEMQRVLKPEGKLILVVPDIAGICENLLKNPDNEWNWAHIYGCQSHDGQYHKTAFTLNRISQLLGFAGFNFVHIVYGMPQDGIKRLICEAGLK